MPNAASRFVWSPYGPPPPRAQGPCDVVPVEPTQQELDIQLTDDFEDELPGWITDNRRVLAWRLVCAWRQFSMALLDVAVRNYMRHQPWGGHGLI